MGPAAHLGVVRRCTRLLSENPNVEKAGGFQSQGAKGAAVVYLLQALGNAGSGVLRLSQRVNTMA